MSDQFDLSLMRDDRERRAELVGKRLSEDIEKLSSKMCDLTEFMFPESIARMAVSA